MLFKLFANSCGRAHWSVLRNALNTTAVKNSLLFFFSFFFSLCSPCWLWSLTECRHFLGFHMCHRPPAERAADSFCAISTTHTHTREHRHVFEHPWCNLYPSCQKKVFYVNVSSRTRRILPPPPPNQDILATSDLVIVLWDVLLNLVSGIVKHL